MSSSAVVVQRWSNNWLHSSFGTPTEYDTSVSAGWSRNLLHRVHRADWIGVMFEGEHPVRM